MTLREVICDRRQERLRSLSGKSVIQPSGCGVGDVGAVIAFVNDAGEGEDVLLEARGVAHSTGRYWTNDSRASRRTSSPSPASFTNAITAPTSPTPPAAGLDHRLPDSDLNSPGACHK